MNGRNIGNPKYQQELYLDKCWKCGAKKSVTQLGKPVCLKHAVGTRVKLNIREELE